jgi:hypothetical protein
MTVLLSTLSRLHDGLWVWMCSLVLTSSAYCYVYVYLLTGMLSSAYSLPTGKLQTDWGFPRFFLSCKANARVYLAETARSALFLISELCCSLYCLCVNVYCTTATGYQPNCSLIYQIVPYHVLRIPFLCGSRERTNEARFEDCPVVLLFPVKCLLDHVPRMRTYRLGISTIAMVSDSPCYLSKSSGYYTYRQV